MFISDFCKLNKNVKMKPYPLPFINNISTDIDKVNYTTTELIMSYYTTLLNKKPERDV